MEERRRFVRLNARLPVTYLILPSGTRQHSTTKNLGGGGISFYAEKALRSGTHLQMALTLPDREEPAHFTAEVTSSVQYATAGKGGSRRSVEVGVRFLEIAPKDQEAVMEYVTRHLQSPPQ